VTRAVDEVLADPKSILNATAFFLTMMTLDLEDLRTLNFPSPPKTDTCTLVNDDDGADGLENPFEEV